MAYESADAWRDERNAGFVFFDFFWDANDHFGDRLSSLGMCMVVDEYKVRFAWLPEEPIVNSWN